MPFIEINAEEWTSVATTTADTLFQNRSGEAMYITTEDTTGLPTDEGFLLNPVEAIVIGTGLAVSASTHNTNGILFYMDVT